jgi:hypothetical protein
MKKILRTLKNAFNRTLNPQKTSTIEPSDKIIRLTQADMDKLQWMLQTLIRMNLQREIDLLKIRGDFKKS